MQSTPPEAPTGRPPSPRSSYAGAWAAGLVLAAALGVVAVLPSQRDMATPPAPRVAVEAALPVRPSGTSHVRGRVTDDAGKPLAAALVVLELTPEAVRWDTVTDDSGRFAFAGLPVRALSIAVEAEGHAQHRGSLDAGPHDDLVLALARRAELAVRVDGCGAAGEVFASGGGACLRTVLGDDGSALFTELPAGRYSLRARCGARSGTAAAPVEVVPGGRASARLSASQGCSLSLAVRDADSGAPLAGVSLVLTPLGEPGPRLEIASADDGGARLDGLWPGSYDLHASLQGYVPERSAWTTPSGEGDPLVLSLHGAAELEGQVVDERGLPLADAELRLDGADALAPRPLDAGSALATGVVGELGVTMGPVPAVPMAALLGDALDAPLAVSDAAGRFRITGVLPGSHVLRVSKAGYVPAEAALGALAPHRIRSTRVALSSAGAVHVQVRDEAGLPLVRAHVLLRGARRALGVLSDEHGEARFDDVLGTVHVALANGTADAGCALDVTARAVAECVLTGAPSSEALGPSASAASVGGLVLDMVGHPVPDAVVSDDAHEHSARSGADGRFSIYGVPEGLLLLQAEHPEAGQGEAAAVRVRAGADPSDVRIVLSGRHIASAEPARAADEDVHFGLRGEDLVVLAVRPGGAAAHAGLLAHDLLLSVDGERALSAAHARGMLRDPEGSIAVVRVKRAGRPFTVRLKRARP
jgi:Carboxypeptidase regulatory-like domain/PDZ domain